MANTQELEHGKATPIDAEAGFWFTQPTRFFLNNCFGTVMQLPIHCLPNSMLRCSITVVDAQKEVL